MMNAAQSEVEYQVRFLRAAAVVAAQSSGSLMVGIVLLLNRVYLFINCFVFQHRMLIRPKRRQVTAQYRKPVAVHFKFYASISDILSAAT